MDGILEIALTPERATLPALFGAAEYLHGPDPLIVFDDNSTMSYAEAASLSRAIAARLQASGAGRGERVVSISAASAEAAIVFWACALAGAVFVPLDGATPSGRLSGILQRTRPKAVFMAEDYAHREIAAGLNTILYRPDDLSAWLQGGGAGFEAPDIRASDAAVVLFTSGTSGEPKGVVLSHGALCGSARLMKEAYGWGPQDRIFSTGDFHTMSGLRNPCVAALSAGASFIIAPREERSGAMAAALLMERLGATVLCTVPAFLAQFTRFAEKVPKGFAKRLKFVMCTGTSLPISAEEAFESLYGVPVLNYYGLTETSGICIGVPPGMERKYRSTIGVPLGTTGIRLDAQGSGGDEGELLIRTENLMSGYCGEPDGAGAVEDGWYRTRDLCRKRADGAIELIGRVDDAFKDQRGELAHPSEVERVLEGSAHVLEAAVCGIDGDDGRPSIAAFVVPKEKGCDERAIVNELRQSVLKALGPYRTPSFFRFVDALPRGINGKILRRRIKEELA